MSAVSGLARSVVVLGVELTEETPGHWRGRRGPIALSVWMDKYSPKQARPGARWCALVRADGRPSSSTWTGAGETMDAAALEAFERMETDRQLLVELAPAVDTIIGVHRARRGGA